MGVIYRARQLSLNRIVAFKMIRDSAMASPRTIDRFRMEAEAAAMWNLGLGEPHPVSALHGRGSGDLLDAILDALPEAPRENPGAPRGPRRPAQRQLLPSTARWNICAGSTIGLRVWKTGS